MNDVPKSIESDDEKFDQLMDLQDPMGLVELEEDEPTTIEEKYERQLTLEKVVKPMLDRMFSKMNDESRRPEDV